MSIATKRQALSFIGLAAALGLSVVGCQSDDPTGPDQITVIEPGQINVSSTPADINAPWFLIQPDQSVVEGSGAALLEEMPGGQYKLVWAPVPGWYSPEPKPTCSPTVKARALNAVESLAPSLSSCTRTLEKEVPKADSMRTFTLLSSGRPLPSRL